MFLQAILTTLSQRPYSQLIERGIVLSYIKKDSFIDLHISNFAYRGYLHLLGFSGPDRQASTQIHPDTIQDELLHFRYDQPVQVGPDEADSATWPKYYVAYVTRIKQIKKDGRTALLCEGHLAKEKQWPQFTVPDELIRAVRFGENL